MDGVNYNQEQLNNSFNRFAEKHAELRAMYRIKVPLTKEEAESWDNLKEGDMMERNPYIPNTPKEAFQLFVDFYATIQLELYKHIFFEKYRIVNKASIEAELLELDKWIAKAEKESYSEACNNNSYSDKNNEYEYLRLTRGFYDGYLMTHDQHYEGSTAACIYGQYILFYKFLKETLKSLKGEPSKDIRSIIRSIDVDLLSFYDMSLESFYNKTLYARKEIFGDIAELEHCERELLVQDRTYAIEIEKSLNHKEFDWRLVFVALSAKRKKFIEFLKEKIEELSLPEVPSISSLINSNLNISGAILDAYYRLVPQPSEETELPSSYVGKRNRYNAPYNTKVYGAYVLSIDWEHLEIRRQRKVKPFDIISEQEVEAALMDYGRGFKKGYFNFERDVLGIEDIKAVLSNSYLVKVVYDYVFGSFFTKGGYPESYGNGGHVLELWYDTGIEAGRYYRAWYVILEFYYLFEDYFKTGNDTNVTVSEELKMEDEKNDYLASTIDDYLEPFCDGDIIHKKSCQVVKDVLITFFKNNEIKSISPVFIKKGNKKKLAFACGEIYRSTCSNPISYEFLLLLKGTFLIYSNEIFERHSLNRSSLYKYCTTKA